MMPLDVSRRGVAIYAWPPFERLDGVQTIVNCDPVQCDPAAIAAFDLGIGVIRDRAKCENELTGVIHTSTHDIQYMVTARGRGFSGHEVLAGAPEHVQIAEIAIARCFNAFNAGYGNPIGP